MNKKRIVLVGLQGQGKTTFFNKITNQNQPTQYAGQSCTRQIVVGIATGIEEFDVFDTPGFNSSQDKLLHVAGILAALTNGTINRILIIVKYGRNDAMKEKFDKIFRLIQRYKDIITIVVTHWDELEANVDEDTERQRIAAFYEKNYKVNSILYFSEQQSPQNNKNTCIEIEKCLFTNQQQTLKLTDGEIYKFFELLELSAEIYDVVENQATQILMEFRRIARIYKLFIETQKPTDQNFIPILHEIIAMIKKEASNKVDQFEQKYGEEIVKLVDVKGHKIQYLQYIRLKRELQNDVEFIIKLAQEQMAKSKYHFFNFLKRCPYCQQIWLKVTGCDNETFCGSRVNSKHDGLILIQANKKIKIVREDQQLIVQVNDQSLSVRDDFIEQIMQYIQQKCNYQAQTNLHDQIKQILEAEYGQNYKENIIQQFLKGRLDEIQLVSRVSFRLGEDPYNNQNLNMLPPPIHSLPQNFQMIQQSQYEQFDSTPYNYRNLNYFGRFNTQMYQQENDEIGCGREIIWKDIPPIDIQEIQELFSSELLEYFSDQDQVIQDEANWLDRTYKQLLIDTVQDQIKATVYLEKSNVK